LSIFSPGRGKAAGRIDRRFSPIVRTRVKICGLTRVEDVAAAAECGADAVGLVFHPGSPRSVSMEQARALCAALPAFVTAVGLFVDAPPERVREVLQGVPLELLQFHGTERADYCRSFGRRWIKALRMAPGVDPEAAALDYPGAAGLLLDAYDPLLAGGTGRTFDWDRIPADLARRVVLAGGLDAANVAEAIRRVRPFGVDVSGGVESAKGVKDRAKISAFMQGVRDGDSARDDP
jgi:phosphoribosylanthranilate isomerase